MCGIAGIVANTPVVRQVIAAMTERLVHRGPDDGGLWMDDAAHVAFGHRRLAIVDLSPNGRQPMTSQSGRWTIAYNGEIYNHRDLRRTVAGARPGLVWRGTSDTEALVEAIDALGLARATAESVGMFAFAAWDRDTRTLHLVRDRFGEKPLYFGWCGDDFVFASELKAIAAHPRFDPALSAVALAGYAARAYVGAPLSIYRSVFKLEPGCVLTLAAGARCPDEVPRAGYDLGGLTIRRYWDYAKAVEAGFDDPIDDVGEAREALAAALAEAIAGQAVADVPVGCFLSGGIDSSLVTAYFQKHAAQPIRTFTLGFAEDGFDEARYARAVAERLGTIHTELYVSSEEARGVIPLLASMYDEPFADSSQIPTFIVSRLAREQVTVALSGDGGDELFGGYNRYLGVGRAWQCAERLPGAVRHGAARALAMVPPEAWTGAANTLSRHRRSPYFGIKIRRTFETMARPGGFGEFFDSFLDDWAGQGSPLASAVAPLASAGSRASEPRDVAARMMLIDATGYLPDDILCKVDRAAMAVSLETRVPFLDHRLAELACRVPLAMKIGGGRGKVILRDLLYREVPQSLFERPKAGFGIPVGDWLRGPLRDWAEHLLDPRRLAEQGIYDPQIVRKRWDDHLALRLDGSSALWAVLMFQSWYDHRPDTADSSAF